MNARRLLVRAPRRAAAIVVAAATIAAAMAVTTNVARAQVPGPGAHELPPKVRRALVELEQGKEVARNAEILRGAIDGASDPGTFAYEVGTVLLNESFFPQAQEFLAIARERKPKDGFVALQLGKAYTALKRFLEGHDALLAAEQLLPPGPRPILHQYLSMVLTGLQREAEAEARAKRAIDEARAWNAAVGPAQKKLDEVDFLLNLANVYQQFFRYDDALKVLDALPDETPTPTPNAPAAPESPDVPEAVEAKDRAKAWLVRGQILEVRGDEAGAAQAFARQHELAPQDARSAYEFGLFHVRHGRPAAARPLLEEATRLDPSIEGALFSLAHVLIRVGEKDAGKQMLARYQQVLDARIANDQRLNELRDRLREKNP